MGEEWGLLRRTYILFNQEKSVWRMAPALDSKGEFAKVKVGL